jgi:hypothetical protein
LMVDPKKNRDIGLPTKNAQPLTWINWDNLGKCFLKKKSRRLHKGSLAFTWIRDLENTCQTNGANSLSLDGKCPFSIGPSKKMNMCPPCLGQKKNSNLPFTTQFTQMSLCSWSYNVIGHIPNSGACAAQWLVPFSIIWVVFLPSARYIFRMNIQKQQLPSGYD